MHATTDPKLFSRGLQPLADLELPVVQEIEARPGEHSRVKCVVSGQIAQFNLLHSHSITRRRRKACEHASYLPHGVIYRHPLCY